MNFTNTVFPGPEQTAAFFGGAEDGPFVMINLLKFRERAAYPDYQAIEKHRVAGLAGQLNIRTKRLGA